MESFFGKLFQLLKRTVFNFYCSPHRRKLSKDNIDFTNNLDVVETQDLKITKINFYPKHSLIHNSVVQCLYELIILLGEAKKNLWRISHNTKASYEYYFGKRIELNYELWKKNSRGKLWKWNVIHIHLNFSHVKKKQQCSHHNRYWIGQNI